MTRLWPKGEPVEILGDPNAPTGFTWRTSSCPPGQTSSCPAGQTSSCPAGQTSSHHILAVCNRWRIHTRWWEPDEAVWREYLKVETETGLLCLLYRDLMHGGWFLARIYD